MLYISFFFLSINSVLQILILSPFYQIKLLGFLVATFEFHSTWGLETTLEVHLGDLFLANRDVFKSSRIIIDPSCEVVYRCCEEMLLPTRRVICWSPNLWGWWCMEVIRFGWDIRSYRKRPENSSCSAFTMWGHSKKMIIWKPGRGLPRARLANTLTLPPQPPGLWEINICGSSYPVSGILLQASWAG